MSDTTPTDPSAASTPTSVEEIWTYLGLRSSKGASEHHWRDAAGELRIFEKLKAPFVGGRYRLDVTHKPNGGVSVVPDPKFVGTLEEIERRGLVAEHRANEVALEAWRAAKKETTEAIDAMTIAELRAKLRRLPVTRGRALLAIILDRLHNGKVTD